MCFLFFASSYFLFPKANARAYFSDLSTFSSSNELFNYFALMYRAFGGSCLFFSVIMYIWYDIAVTHYLNKQHYAPIPSTRTDTTQSFSSSLIQRMANLMDQKLRINQLQVSAWQAMSFIAIIGHLFNAGLNVWFAESTHGKHEHANVSTFVAAFNRSLCSPLFSGYARLSFNYFLNCQHSSALTNGHASRTINKYVRSLRFGLSANGQ